MRGSEYIRGVFKEIAREQTHKCSYPKGAFLGAALDMMHDLESPLKEETFVRLAILELDESDAPAVRVKMCG